MEVIVILCGIMAVFGQLSTCQNLVAVEVSAKLPYPTRDLSTLYDGKDSIYIFGGIGFSGDNAIRGIYRYNIQDDTISEVGIFSEQLTEGIATFDNDGNILYMGAIKYGAGFDDKIYKLNLSTWTLTVVGQAVFGHFNELIRVVDETNTLLIAGHQTTASSGNLYCLDLETFESCGTTHLLSKYYWNIRSFVYDNHAYLTGTYIPGYIEKVNLDTLISELVDARLPTLVLHDVVFDGTYAYIVGLEDSPTNGIIRLNPETFEHEFFPVEKFPVDQSNPSSYWRSGSAVYVEKLQRIYFVGGYTFPVSAGSDRDEIWFIDLHPLGGPPTTTESPISTILSTTEPLIPTTEPLIPTTETLIPTTEPLIPTTEPLIPTTETLIPTTEPLIPTTEPLIPTTEPSISTTTLNPNIFTCLGKPNGLYPHPFDCAKYIECRDETEIFYECPAPLLFSPILLACTLEFDCDISCDGKPEGLYAHPHSCTLFIACHDEIAEVLKCPGELLFDPELQQCNYPEEVDCKILN